jgi:glycosyltransferase involved in cell wall biosynthesis
MKPTLLVFTSTFPRWENDTDPPFVFELARRLIDDFNVHVLTPHYPGAKTHESINGITIHRFRYFFKKYEILAGSVGILPTLKRNKMYYLLVPFFLFSGLVSLSRLIAKLKPDLIHSHWLIPQGLLTAISTRFFCTTPFIVTIHGADLFALKGKYFILLKAFVIKHAAKVAVVSNIMREVVEKQYPFVQNLEVLPMGVDGQIFNTYKRNRNYWLSQFPTEMRILFVGRLSEKKGVKYLLEAAAILLKENLEFKITIVGDGELRSGLQNYADQISVGEYIEFLGSKPNSDLPDIYIQNDVFIGPSIEASSGDTEGLGLTFIEAGMSGCLILGTSVGGIEDVILEKQTGLVVPQKDGRAIAEAILYAQNNKAEMTNLIKNCRKHCKNNFDWKYVASEYIVRFQEILQAKEDGIL